jgi:hypothetical protein
LLDKSESDRQKTSRLQLEMLKNYFQLAKYKNIFEGK